MASIIGFVQRIRTIHNPPEVAKSADALRIGLLGASWIAPQAVILPAKSHPEVIVASLAARDPEQAAAYAKKHGIPHVHDTYEALISDPTIQAVYIPLPNGLHYTYARLALQAKKHVLLEKPFTSNASEAAALWAYHSSLPEPRPILLEAVHYLFHPAWQTFLTFLSPPDIASATAKLGVFAGFLKPDDIRFKYELAGGAMMDMGTYTVSALRQIFGTEPTECVSATPRKRAGDDRVDEAFAATWSFPNGGRGSISADLAMHGRWGLPAMLTFWPPEDISVEVVHRAVAVPDSTKASTDETHLKTRTVKMANFVGPHYFHSIMVTDVHSLTSKSTNKVTKTWTEKATHKAYTWPTPAATADGHVRNGEDYWTTYRHMLEAFVDRIRGRPGSGVWVDEAYSVPQMRMMDSGYEKAGMPLRPSSLDE